MMVAAIVLLFGLPAVLIDSQSHRIPNVLVLATLVAAFAMHVWLDGAAGAKFALAGSLIGLAILLPLYVCGAMGAGDVKFMAALGALLGPGGAVLAGVLTLAAGGLLALATVAWRRRALAADPSSGNAPAISTRLPYAAAIVTGALTATLLNGPAPHG